MEMTKQAVVVTYSIFLKGTENQVLQVKKPSVSRDSTPRSPDYGAELKNL
jgi:L-rhamnose mutarotase